MFTLLLIIGALAASAGLYTLFSDSSKTVPETTSPESQTKKPDESLKFERGKEFRISSASPAETVQPVTQALPKTIPLQELTKKIKEGNLRSKKKLKLTYDTDDIINKNSRYSFHRRPLLNSETLVEKENYNGALEILGRTEARIPDEEIKSKINKNIDDIKKFLSGDEEDDLFSPEDEKYSKVEVPFSDLVHAIKEISEGLAGTLNRGFSIPISMPTMQGAVPSPSYSPQTESGKSSQQGAQSQSPQKESGKSAQSGVKGTAATADFSGGGEFRVVGVPVIIDPSAFGGILPPPESKDMKLPSREIPSYSGMPPVIYQFFQGSPGGGPGLAPPPPELFSPGSPSAPGNGPSQFPKSPLEKDQEKKLSDFLDKPDSGIESADNVPDIGSLDNFYFDDEWDKFKDLPIKDRRSGKERRQGSDRRNEFLRKDRRSGEDRRKTDLFREREQYLKQKEDQKKEDNLKKLFDNKKLSEIVPQFGGGGQPFFPELIPILLPDP
ncbi:MAG: hypothetical protein K8R21_05000, partial [Leptospira sp.]|nr:hypothetical protein [Leptospira sp.]